MRQSTAFLLAFASASLADTTLPFFWPGLDSGGVDPVASVISANPSTTVLELACPTNVDETECGWGNAAITYSIISTTVYEAVLSTSSLSASFSCAYDKNTAMACAAVVQDPQMTAGGFSGGVESDTTTLTGDEVEFHTMTVTAGEDKLSASGAASQSAPASSFATSVSATGSVAATTGSGPTASGASATGSGVPAQSTGAAGRFGVEGVALLALAGAAVAGAW